MKVITLFGVHGKPIDSSFCPDNQPLKRNFQVVDDGFIRVTRYTVEEVDIEKNNKMGQQ